MTTHFTKVSRRRNWPFEKMGPHTAYVPKRPPKCPSCSKNASVQRVRIAIVNGRKQPTAFPSWECSCGTRFLDRRDINCNVSTWMWENEPKR